MPSDQPHSPSTSPHDGADRRARIAEYGSLCALLVSVLALSLGAYQAQQMNVQTRLMQSQSRASVWPYLSIGYSISDEGDHVGYTWQVNNDGVGPARIESVTMTLDGKPVEHWKDVFRVLYGDTRVPASYAQVYGKVLPPNTNRETTIEALRIPDLQQAKIFYAAQDRFDMTICYCSVYDDCWIAHREGPVVQPVPRCDTRGTPQFEPRM
jgi:hypothetical protein